MNLLKEFTEIKYIKASCLEGPVCKEGCCKAVLRHEPNEYSLVTGIIPNADFLGSFTFGNSHIIDDDESSVTVNAYAKNGKILKIKLELFA